MDLRAEPLVLSVPAVEKSALLRRCSSLTGTPLITAISAAARPATMPVTTWSPDPIGKATRPPGIKKVFHSETQFWPGGLSHAALWSRGHAECGQSPVRLQSPAALAVSEATRTAALHLQSTFPRLTRTGLKTPSSTTSTSSCNSLRQVRRKTHFGRSLPAWHRGG